MNDISVSELVCDRFTVRERKVLYILRRSVFAFLSFLAIYQSFTARATSAPCAACRRWRP
jgi:hypothetical protein